MAHNCHGKTKSHGTTNLTYGKTNLTHGKTKLTHGKTEKTSWSAVGQRLLFETEIVRRVTVNKRNAFVVNSGGVKKKPMIILKEFTFIRFCFNKRRQRLAGVRGFTMK